MREYIFHYLKRSDDPKDRLVANKVMEALKPLGYVLNEKSAERVCSIMPNILKRSRSKIRALVEVLENDYSWYKINFS